MKIATYFSKEEEEFVNDYVFQYRGRSFKGWVATKLATWLQGDDFEQLKLEDLRFMDEPSNVIRANQEEYVTKYADISPEEHKLFVEKVKALKQGTFREYKISLFLILRSLILKEVGYKET
jgi:hypothetical protein